MKLTTERKPGSIVELTIEADDAEFQKAVDDAVTRQSGRVQIPGFRKGHAPRHMVERFYGGREAFQQDAAERLMDTYYREALEQEELRVVGDPEVTDLGFDPTLNFTIAVPVYPEITLGDYTAVRAESKDASVGDDDVDQVLTRLQRQQAEWTDVSEDRTPKEGDQITLDYSVLEGDQQFQEPIEDAEWVLGETNLLPALRDRLEAMKPGDTESFDLLFEEDDETADPSIRGKQLSYTVTLKGIKEKNLGELNDDFAKAAAGVDTLDELKQQIRTDVHQGKTNEARNEVLNGIIGSIGESSEIDLPSAMIDEEVEHQLNHRKEDLQRQGLNWDQWLMMSGASEDDVKADLRPEAEQRLRNTMILQEIARRENIVVEDADLDNEINRLAGDDLNPDEADQEGVERARRMRDVYNSDYFRDYLRNDLFERKLTDRIIEIATEGKGAVLNGYDAETAPKPAPKAKKADESSDPASGMTDQIAADNTEVAGNDEVDTTPRDTTTAGETPSADATSDLNAEMASDNAEVIDGNSETIEPTVVNVRREKLPDRGEGTDWVAGDGTRNIPEGFPIKGNASSKIYHPAESPSYNSTIAEIYFASNDVAEAHGYRLPKSMQ